MAKQAWEIIVTSGDGRFIGRAYGEDAFDALISLRANSAMIEMSKRMDMGQTCEIRSTKIEEGTT